VVTAHTGVDAAPPVGPAPRSAHAAIKPAASLGNGLPRQALSRGLDRELSALARKLGWCSVVAPQLARPRADQLELVV
jgi:hypothetical protein